MAPTESRPKRKNSNGIVIAEIAWMRSDRKIGRMFLNYSLLGTGNVFTCFKKFKV